MSSPWDDLFSGIGGNPPQKPQSQPEKGVQLHGRRIDGSYYVRASDVARLLEINEVLPGVAKRLRQADAR